MSSRVFPSEDADIVSPASESIRRTLPHSSTTAALKCSLMAAMFLSKRVERAVAMPLIRFDAGLILLRGGRSMHEGSM